MTGGRRVDGATRLIRATPERIWRAFMDRDELARWLPPDGMSGEVLAFEPHEGGAFEIALTYKDAARQGKSSAHADVVRGRFGPLVEARSVVWLTRFESDDPRFAGTMRMTWAFVAVPGGTEVTIRAQDVPPGIDKADHDMGLNASLDGLQRAVE